MLRSKIALIGLLLAVVMTTFVAVNTSDAGERNDFWFRNASGATITQLYVAEGHEDEWGPDRLGEYVLGPGEEFFVRFRRPHHCRYDVMVVWEDGSTWQQPKRVNVCEVVRLTLRCNRRGCWTEAE